MLIFKENDQIHSKRRPTVCLEQRQNWLQEIQEDFQTVPMSLIVNCDETAWLFCPNGVLGCAER
jgi:hypothetical protein